MIKLYVDPEHLKNVETVCRVFKKCEQIDRILGKPAARTEIQKYIKPLMSFETQAREASSLEGTIDGLLAAVKILKET